MIIGKTITNEMTHIWPTYGLYRSI